MSTFQDIDNLMQHFLAKKGPAGFCIAVTRGEETVYEQYYGYADVAETKPLSPEHVFRQYSMTKPLAALCGLIQLERGVFLLDDPISAYLPEYKHMQVQVMGEDGKWELRESKTPVTLRHAFTMGVGMLAHDGSPTDTYNQEIHEKLGGKKLCNKYDHLTEVRALAEASGLLNARKSESQDICFVPDGKYAQFIEKETGEKNLPGSFVDAKGKILGIHKGMINYTTGQRKHLGISLPPEAETLYVCGKNAKTNTVLLGTGKQLERKELTAKECNLIVCDMLSEPLHCCAKFRYRQPEQPVTVEQTGEASLKITFDAPQRGIAPGQSVVLYDGERVLGGGIIE